MTLASLWTVITKILDIGLIWLIIYYSLRSFKHNVKLVLIFKGVSILIFIKILSSLLNLYTVGILFEYVISWGLIALIIIFQPEIRSVLEQIGRSQLLGRHKVLTTNERTSLVNEIMASVEYLKRNRIGALIVIERNVSLQEYIEPAIKIYADISSELLTTIFFDENPLHDGGVILQGNKLTAASAVFKTSMSPNVSKTLGTRHRAALGVAEETDAIALVVSEETGRLSIAFDGKLNYNLTINEFKEMLSKELEPINEVFYDSDEEGEVNEK